MPPAKKAAGTTSGHPASKTSKTSKTSTSRKAVLSTAEQLDRLEEAKRAKHKSHRKKGDKQHAGALEPSGTLQQIDLSGLEPVEELVAPTLAVLNAIKERQAVALERIKELGGLRQGEQVHTDAAVDEHGPAGGDALSDAGLQRAVTSPSPAAVAPPSAVDDKLARGKWRVFASDALAAMASSLEGALHNDAKLRALFESIDLDSGGTIDKEELRSAFKRADISGDDDALDMMFRAADVDDSGEIDYDEFVGVLRGVKKANTAASVIERRYRTHAAVAKGRGGMGASKVAGVKNAPQSGKEAAALSKAEKDRLMMDALLERRKEVAELVSSWARTNQSSITKVEFRHGVKVDLKLPFDGPTVDAWFARLDTDGSGAVDVPELKAALQRLEETAKGERKERASLSKSIAAMQDDEAVLSKQMHAARDAARAAHATMERLAAHRAKVAISIDVRIGERLSAKLHSVASTTLEDMVTNWSLGRAESGWLTKEEFVQRVSVTLSEVTVKRQKSEATKLNAFGLNASIVPEATTSKETAQGMVRQQVRSDLSGVDAVEHDVEACFNAFDLALAPDGALRGKVEIRPTIEMFLAADQESRALDVRLCSECVALRDEALEGQKRLRTMREQIVRKHEQQDVDAKARAEEHAKTTLEQRAARLEANGKRSATSQMPRHLLSQPLSASSATAMSAGAAADQTELAPAPS